MNAVDRRWLLAALTGLWLAPLGSCTDQSTSEQPASGGAATAGASNASGASAGSSAAGTGAAGASAAGASNGGGGQSGGGGGGTSAGSAGIAGSGASGGDGSGGSAGSGELSGELHLYWVDVEGGAATIIVAPNGKVLLVDTGNPGGRDAGRILEVLESEVQAERLDHVIITHYHGDHVGGAAEIAAGIEVLEFVDHGDSVEAGQGTSYPALAAGRRRTVVPGDTIDVGQASLTIVASAAAVIDEPLGPNEPNPLCEGAVTEPKTGEENGASVGYVLGFGSFQFVDLGDLTWGGEHDLACPVNEIGEIDLLQVPHHGLAVSSPPQLLHALNPLAAVASNGPNKGNAPSTYETVTSIPDLAHLWLIHRSEGNDAAHNPPDDYIANLQSGQSDQAHFIHARVTASGAFTIENSRNGHVEAYQAR